MKLKIVWFLLFAAANNIYAAPDIQHWQTNNGGKVLFVETHVLPIVDIRIAFDAGGARDDKLSGIASLTNKVLPTGSKNYTEDELAAAFDNQGALFGHSSHRDMSVFTLRSLSKPEQLTPVVEALSDILTQPLFPDKPFMREKEHVMVGLKSEEQNPATVAEREFMQALYNEHPYGSWPSGTMKSIGKITVRDVEKFYRRYFTGKNLVLTIVGDLTTLEAKNLANKLIGKLPEGGKAPKPEKVSLPAKEKIKKIEFPSEQTHIIMGYPGLERGDPDYFPLYVGNHILGGNGLVSKISEEIREKRGLAYSAYSYFYPMRARGPFKIGLQTKNESAADALKVVKTIISDFIAKGPNLKELELAKKNIIGGFALRIDSNSKQAEYINMIGFYDLPPDYLETFNQNVKAVTAEQITQAWKKRINPDKMITVMVGKPGQP